MKKQNKNQFVTAVGITTDVAVRKMITFRTATLVFSMFTFYVFGTSHVMSDYENCETFHKKDVKRANV